MAGPPASRMMGILSCIVLLLSIVELTNAQGSAVPVITNYTALDNRYLPESLPLGFVLGTISAYDPDNPSDRTSLTYAIRGSGGEYFQIGENTGIVTLKKVLDFENEIEIRMTIWVQDGDGQVTTRDAKVFVTDENDNAPVFDKTGLFSSIAENQPVGFTVVPITVTDRDTKNDVITVTCEGQTQQFIDACNTFHLKTQSNSNKGWTGWVILNSPLDYERRLSYNILLVARDGVHNVSTEVHIEVEDINDSPPKWIESGPKVIPEEQPIGTSIQRVSAEDSDKTNPRPIRYSLIGPNTDVFTIDNTTGVISNKAPLDYDCGSHQKGVPYDVVIKASELINANTGVVGNDNLTTATVSIKVTVQDINDNSPTFTCTNQATPTTQACSQKEEPSCYCSQLSSSYSGCTNTPACAMMEYRAYVDENIVSGSNIPGLMMTITDRDSGTFNSFDLKTLNNTDVFGIIPSEDAASSSATIYVKDGQKIDYESGIRQYVIDIQAVENRVSTGIHTGSARVTICVLDVNDQTPTFGQEVYVRNVSETASPNTFIIDLNATDPEAGNFGTAGIRYKLYGNIPPHFKIDERTGVVTVADCPSPGRPGLYPCIDYERKQEYTLTVSATDNLGQGRTRSVQLIIGIIDENDNAPRIEASYTRYIYEGQIATINPLLIEPVDPDKVGGPITFSLRADTTGLWQITPEMVNGRLVGNITARRKILYEDAPNQNTGEFNFAVVVEDQKYSMTGNVKIIVIDINNNAPQFAATDYIESIPETTTGEIYVTTVSARDADAPTTGNGVVDFYIERGALGKFMLTNVTLVNGYWVADVYTTKDSTFDYDIQNEYVMPLIARDRGSPNSLSGTSQLTVRIIDVNNRNPVIRPNFQTINVRENEPIGTTVYRVTAEDPDQDSVLEFFMEATDAIDGALKTVDPANFNFSNLFRIEKDTGYVVVNAPLDRDVVSRISNNLTVHDVSANPVQTGKGILLIRILEYNDQSPYFDRPLYNITIDEELNINSFVQNLNCQDDDDRIAGYSLEQIVPRRPEFFDLVGGSGAMIVSSRIDFEQIEEIELTAYCTDTGNPARSNSTRVLVHIRNINDNSPIFEQPLYRTEVEENTVGGKLNVSIKATDLDKGDFGVVRFKLDPTDPNTAFFDIDPITAEITIKPNAQFDRELGGYMGINVIAYDSPLNLSLSRQTTVPVYITIKDVNDNCPVFSKTLYEGKVPESAERETDIIDIIVTDADEGINSQVVFTITPNSWDPPDSENYFGIGFTNGRILVNSNLRDKAGFYKFNVTATDMKGEHPGEQCSVQVPVIVQVEESDNNAPEWIRPPQRDFVIYVLEEQYEGMLVYGAKAIDSDSGPNGVVDYFFTVNGDELVSRTAEFRINRVTGVIRAEVVFDRERRDSYFLTLMAKDRGNPAASSEITITVIILDVDDNDPVFPMRNGEVIPLVLPKDGTIPEGAPITGQGTLLGHCEATDADSDHDNNRIYYELLAAKEEVRQYITVDQNTCDIYLIKEVDYETMPTLEFDVYAYNLRSDDAVIREKRAVNPSIQHVTVNIADNNDNAPEFYGKPYLACVSVNAPLKQNILEVSATDKDATDNANIKYSLDSNNKNFAIDPDLGVISNLIIFRPGGSPSYTFNVQATDGKNNAEPASVSIFVTSPSNIVKLTVNRPLTDVEPFKQQLIDTLVDSSDEISSACVDRMTNHLDGDGQESLLATDVYVTAVKGGDDQYQVLSASALADIIQAKMNQPNSPYDAIYVTDAQEAGEEESFILEEDAVLAILIICILLIFLAIVLIILACFCINREKNRKKRKIQAARHTVVHVAPEPVSTSFNPVYHNAGQEPPEEYATVQKVRPASTPISPVVIPAPEDLQPLPSDEPEDLEPVEPPRPSWEEEEPVHSRWEPDEPEPVIETEVVGEPVREPVFAEPPKPFEPEYEDRIETEIRDDDGPPSAHSSSPPSPARSSPVNVEVLGEPSGLPPPPPPLSPPGDVDDDIEVIVDSRGPSPPASVTSADSRRSSVRSDRRDDPYPGASPSPRASPPASPHDLSPQPSPPASLHGHSPQPSPPPSPHFQRLGDDSD